MPSANVPQLRAELDAFARTRLTLADFDPVLEVEAELDLDEITPGLFPAYCNCSNRMEREITSPHSRPAACV